LYVKEKRERERERERERARESEVELEKKAEYIEGGYESREMIRENY